MAQPAQPNLKIFCILESEKDNVRNAFVINLQKGETVADLRRAIKEERKKTLAEYEVNSILLYFTSIPVHGNFEENAKTALQTELDVPTDKLGTVFPTGPEKDMVHIIVRPSHQPTALPNQPPHVPHNAIAEDEVIKGIVADFQPGLETAINTFLHNNVQLPLWEPIPKTSASSQFPSLLLHKLGQLSHDAQLANRVDRLFAPRSKPKFLFSASGAGKTRLIFEGLLRRWGLYFTARTQPESLGSLDVENVLQRLKKPGRLSRLPEENPELVLASNRDVTSRHLRLILYVRTFVFRAFLERASAMPGGITEDHKRRWLLLQLAPRTLLGRRDIFDVLNWDLQEASFRYLGSSMDSELININGLLSKQPSDLFCVLDEAQAPANDLLDYFRSDTEPVARPVLRQIISEWKDFFPYLIVSGTGVPMQDMETVMGATVAKELGEQSETITDVGAFSGEEDQRAYLESYLPQGYLDLDKGKVMASRVGYWLHGRYRFTATYISRLMQAGFESPNTVLNQFVHDMTTFCPSDYPDDGPINIPMKDVGNFDFSKLKKDEELLRQIAGCIFDYIFTGKPRDLGGPAAHRLVEYGVARFVNTENIKADEPLALLAATAYFNENTNWDWQHFLVDGISNANESARGLPFEQVGAYLLGIAFSSPTPLSKVFKFFGDNELKDERAQLASIYNLDGQPVCQPVNIHSSAPTYILGCSPRTSEDTLGWIKDPDRVVFCFPANAAGPDLFLVLMLPDKTVIRVIVQFKQTMTNMGPAETEKALRSTDPAQFMSQQLQDALGNLGRGAENAGKLSVLRVLISHPASPDADTLTRLADNDRSQHSVATVDLQSLAQVLSKEEIRDSLALRMKANPSNGPQQNTP